ncbi:MAG TPA: L-threonylcarbamoyladenylate synthase [Gammaproteobacteria bacterium]
MYRCLRDPAADFRVKRAARCVRAGGVVAYPTEAVYGIGCLPDDAEAVRRVLRIKRRSWRKGVLLVGANVEQLARYAVIDASPHLEEILASWPGPHTWVLPARRRTPAWITGGRRTVAVRLTAHSISRALCCRAGSALVSTSANRSGRPPLRSALAVRRALGAELDDVLDGPLGGLSSPTTIRDGMTGRVLRP